LINILHNLEIIEQAAIYKCKRSISLADCYTLAIAKLYHCKALFLLKEAELIKELNKEQFDVQIEFLKE